MTRRRHCQHRSGYAYPRTWLGRYTVSYVSGMRSSRAGSTAGAALSGQLIGRIPLAACLPVLAAPVLLTVVPLLTLTRARPARAAPR